MADASEAEALEGEGATRFKLGHEAAEMLTLRVPLQGFLILPGLDDFDMVVGRKAGEGFVAYAAFVVEGEFDKFYGFGACCSCF